MLVAVEIIMTLTDPPLKFLRRYIKPLRLGVIQLDFSWTVVVIAIFFLQGIVTNTFR
jgi:YggT family protein